MRVPTTFRCRWVPNRAERRRFTASDAARVACYAVRDGASFKQIEARFRVLCENEEGKRSELEQAAAVAVEVMRGNVSIYADSLSVLAITIGVLGTFLAVLATLGIIVRPLRLVASAARLLLAQARTLEGTMVRGRAANDSAFRTLEEALRKAA